MPDKNFTNDYWVTMVYVDSYEDNVMRGWFSNPYLKEPEKFSCLSDFIIKNGARVKSHYETILKWWKEDSSLR